MFLSQPFAGCVRRWGVVCCAPAAAFRAFLKRAESAAYALPVVVHRNINMEGGTGTLHRLQKNRDSKNIGRLHYRLRLYHLQRKNASQLLCIFGMCIISKPNPFSRISSSPHSLWSTSRAGSIRRLYHVSFSLDVSVAGVGGFCVAWMAFAGGIALI